MKDRFLILSASCAGHDTVPYIRLGTGRNDGPHGRQLSSQPSGGLLEERSRCSRQACASILFSRPRTAGQVDSASPITVSSDMGGGAFMARNKYHASQSAVASCHAGGSLG